MDLLNKRRDLISFFFDNEAVHFFYIIREKHGYSIEAYRKLDALQVGLFKLGILNPISFFESIANFIEFCDVKKPCIAVGILQDSVEEAFHYDLILRQGDIPFSVRRLQQSVVAFRSKVKQKVANHLMIKAVNLWKE